MTKHTLTEIRGPETREDGTIVAHFIPGMSNWSSDWPRPVAWIDTANQRVAAREARKLGMDWTIVRPANPARGEAGVIFFHPIFS